MRVKTRVKANYNSKTHPTGGDFYVWQRSAEVRDLFRGQIVQRARTAKYPEMVGAKPVPECGAVTKMVRLKLLRHPPLAHVPPLRPEVPSPQ